MLLFNVTDPYNIKVDSINSAHNGCFEFAGTYKSNGTVYAYTANDWSGPGEIFNLTTKTRIGWLDSLDTNRVQHGHGLCIDTARNKEFNHA